MVLTAGRRSVEGGVRMAYYSRKPEGIFWSQHIARAFHFCMGANCEKNIYSGDIYFARRTRLHGRPIDYCVHCAEKEKKAEREG